MGSTRTHPFMLSWTASLRLAHNSWQGGTPAVRKTMSRHGVALYRQ